MPGKKQQKNAFYYFMEDFKKKLPPDQQKLSRNEIRNLAGPSWEKLSAKEKAKYAQKAKQTKPNAMFSDVAVKFTTTGRAFEEIDKEEQDKKMKDETMKLDINTMVTIAANLGNIANKRFYLIHCNYYCYVQDIFYPCELAVCEYSLKDGIMRTYHTFIDSGPIPLGYKHEVVEHAKDTHKIPHPPPAGAQNDYCKLYTDIYKFISAGREEDGRLPPVFTYYNIEHLHYNMTYGAVVESVLEQLCTAANDDDKPFRVYPLTKLFTELHTACVNISSESSEKNDFVESVAQLLLERDTYSYQSGLSCQFHEEEDNRNFCSLSLAQRWTFPISLKCCDMLHLKVTPGMHFPVSMKIETMSPQKYSGAPELPSHSAVIRQPTAVTEQKTDLLQIAHKSLLPSQSINRSHPEPVRKPFKASLESTLKGIPKTPLVSQPLLSSNTMKTDPCPSGISKGNVKTHTVLDVQKPAGVSKGNIKRHDVLDVQKPLSVAGRGRAIAYEFNSLSIG